MYKATQVPTSGRNGVRAARAIAMVNGYRVPIVNFSVEQNAFNAADSFTLELPFKIEDETTALPAMSSTPEFATQLLTADVVPVQLYVGYPATDTPDDIDPSDLTQIMDGTMDTTEFSFDMQGERVILHGRNKVGTMIDTKVIGKFPNRPASAIATEFAQAHGLVPRVTPTGAYAGTYENQRAAAIGNETSQWDMLLYLAKREHFICRVKGNELWFGPYGTVVPDSDPILYTWGYDIEGLHIERSPHAARNIEVTVLSYDRTKKKQIKEVATSTTQGAGRVKAQVDRRSKYRVVIVVPYLTRQQAQNRARQKLDELSRKQVIGRLTGAGNAALAVDKRLRIEGVGKGLTAEYYVNRVTHRFDLGMGYSVDCGFSSQTDFTQSAEDDSGIVNPAGTVAGTALVSQAQAQDGRKYWPNACARGVDDVLKASGVNLGLTNPNYAPYYEAVGTKVAQADLQPGDLVLTRYGWDPLLKRNDAGHIGIYAGNGQMWNVSSSAGYKWVKTNITEFYMGRRIATP